MNDPIKRMKGQAKEWEKILAEDTPSVSAKYKELFKLNNKRQISQLKGVKNFNRHCAQ